MLNLFYLIWTTPEKTLHQWDETTSTWVDQDLLLGLLTSGQTGEAWKVCLQSSAFVQGLSYTCADLRFSLTGDAAVISQLATEWPTLGGGLEMSFDGGVHWSRFTDPQQRISLSGTAVGINSPDGMLGPFDTAAFLLRIVVPQNASPAKLSGIRILPEFNLL